MQEDRETKVQAVAVEEVRRVEVACGQCNSQQRASRGVETERDALARRGGRRLLDEGRPLQPEPDGRSRRVAAGLTLALERRSVGGECRGRERGEVGREEGRNGAKELQRWVR